ncbi:MAG: hypothetical protein A3B81_05180 [Candidatus Muproteobacteria bacterium RIFCSPHIGHO2_02_FULL_65_16]|uniref:YggT family protein n=1 Tax=Candidatus Muproteobacteria bacterium RIFCSPHIGHO2_02_FULL_65_16 TaxID=1817766 RepID=A0A1F6U5L6_9PROT|nr:MAG: hypothetical protein A3B81_05180 [Candidatus Muproteobacteria bacterium RIFCSPHIGHO2_02_FULL_65_16]
MTPFLMDAGKLLVEVVFGFYTLAVLLRLLFQLVRADFYNPLSQFLVTLTNPPLRPLRRVIPGLWGVDFASVVLLLALKAAELYLIFLLSGVSAPLPLVALAAVADLIRLTLYVFTFAVLGRVIMSWVNPYGGHTHPVAGLLISLTEPLLRPARRLIPPVASLDLSPIAVLVLLQLLLLALEHLLR